MAGYAYRATVPDGIVAYRPPAPTPAHGFALDLTTDGDRISVDGHYNTLEYATARDALATTLLWISGKAKAMRPPQFHTVRLADLRAVEITIKYTDKQTATE